MRFQHQRALLPPPINHFLSIVITIAPVGSDDAKRAVVTLSSYAINPSRFRAPSQFEIQFAVAVAVARADVVGYCRLSLRCQVSGYPPWHNRSSSSVWTVHRVLYLLASVVGPACDLLEECVRVSVCGYRCRCAHYDIYTCVCVAFLFYICPFLLLFIA